MKNKLLYFSILFMFLWVGLSSYWQIFPKRALDIKIQPYQTSQQIYKRGENVGWHTEFCKLIDESAVAKVELVKINGVELQPAYVVLEVKSELEKGCYSKDYDFVKIPNYISPGNYFLKFTSVYEVNPLRDITHVSQTQVFEVIE